MIKFPYSELSTGILSYPFILANSSIISISLSTSGRYEGALHLKIPFSAVETENPRPSSILLVFSLPNSKPNICSISEERT